MNLIEQAVAPLKQASVKAAVEQAEKFIASVERELAEAGWDMRVAIPKVEGSIFSSAYRQARTKREKFEMFVVSDKSYYRPDEPHIVRMDERRISRYIGDVIAAAEASYEAYVAKLNKKVGEVDSAEMTYVNGIWFTSILKVTKGEVTEHWKTSCIVNFSKFHRPFNQWPTRLMKDKKKKAPAKKAVAAEAVKVEKAGFDRKAYMREYNARKRAAKGE